MKSISARSSRAAGPQSTTNRDFAILLARSKSRTPSASPISQWDFGSKPRARGTPHRRISSLSSAVAPAGTDSCGRFGSASSSPSMSPSTRWSAASSSRIRSPTARISRISADASSPRRLAAPIASDVRLRRAFSSSAVRSSSRRCRSASSSSLRMSPPPPRVASARATASGCSRMSFSGSNGGLRRFGRTLLGLDAGDGADAVVRLEVDDADAPRVAALGGDVGRGEPDDLALRGDDENVIRLPHLEHPDDVAVAATGLDVDDALARAALQPVLLERGPLAVAALGHGQDQHALLHHVGGDHLVAILDLDPPDARRGPTHRTRLVLGEADDHAELRRDHDLALAVGPPDRDDLVAGLEPDPLDPAGARMRVCLEFGLLHLPLLRREQDVAAGPEIPDGDAGGDALVLTERQQVHHGLALGLAPALRNLVHLEPVHLAEVREKEEVGVGRGDEDIRDDVLLLRLHPGHALAAAALAPVGLDVSPLDVAGARVRDDHLLVGEQVLDRELGRLGQDFRAARIAVLFLDGQELRPDDRHQFRVGGEDALQLLDEGQRLLVLLHDLVALELG